MKGIFGKVMAAAVLVAFGFGMGLLTAPTPAQSHGCIGPYGAKGAQLKCTGKFAIMPSETDGMDVVDCKLVPYLSGGKTFHYASVTVVKLP